MAETGSTTYSAEALTNLAQMQLSGEFLDDLATVLT